MTRGRRGEAPPPQALIPILAIVAIVAFVGFNIALAVQASKSPATGPLSRVAVTITLDGLNGTCTPPSATATFHANASGGIPPYTYWWSFGNGTTLGFGKRVSYTYSSLEIYNVSVFVVDVALGTGSNWTLLNTHSVCPVPAVV